MRRVEIEIHCLDEEESARELIKQAQRIEAFMWEGNEVEVKVILDGTRRTVYKLNLPKPCAVSVPTSRWKTLSLK